MHRPGKARWASPRAKLDVRPSGSAFGPGGKGVAVAGDRLKRGAKVGGRGMTFWIVGVVAVLLLLFLRAAKAKEYLWAELGALLGAVLAVPLAAVVFLIGLQVLRFESLEDLDRSIKIGLAAAVTVLILGSSIGCWFSLRRAGYPEPKAAARMLFLLLLVTYLAGVAPGSGVDFEPVDAQAILATLVPVVMPLVATWITRRVPKSVMIQVVLLLLVGLGAYGIFSYGP